MNSKIIIGIVVVLVVIVALFLVMKGTAGAPQNVDQTGAEATTTPKVEGQDVSIGTGAEATPGSIVSVLYVGKLQDGTIFDSSAAHNNQPLQFTLGEQGLIPGFQIGVNGMKVGGERLLSIPPTLGYGTQEVKDSAGKVIIPANSVLIFDVKLVEVKPGTSTPVKMTP